MNPPTDDLDARQLANFQIQRAKAHGYVARVLDGRIDKLRKEIASKRREAKA